MNFNFENIITFLGGGVIVAILNFVINKRKENRSDLEIVIKLLQEDNKRLREREESNSIEIDKLKISVSNLQNKIILLESTTNEMPFPMWLKDRDLVMLSVNTKYSEVFGVSADQYVGKTDFEVWDEKTAQEFRTNDERVLFGGLVFYGTENVTVNGKKIDLLVVKYPRKIGNIIIGIAGLAIIKNDLLSYE